MALTLLGTAGCSEDSDGGDFAEIVDVLLLAEPESLTFTATGLGEPTQKTFTIINQTSVPATMRVRLEEEITGDDQIKEFSWPGTFGQLFAGEVELAGNDSLSVVVVYTPSNVVKDTGRIVIDYNDGESIVIPIESNDVSPDIDGPSRIIFGRVPSGGTAQKSISIQNTGRAPLRMGEIFLSDENTEFSYCFPQPGGECLDSEAVGAYPEVLDYLDTFQVRIDYNPIDDGEDTVQLKFQSNDPDEQPFNIDINANGAEPCIIVTDELGLDFGTGFIGAVSQRTMTIENCSPNKALEISGISMVGGNDEEFFIDVLPGNLPDDVLVVPVDETASFVVNYAPVEKVLHQGTIEILSNDEAKSPLLIPVSGRGDDNACPVPVAKGKELGTNIPLAEAIETIPLKTIQFDASESTDPDNPAVPDAIAGYEWTLVQQPPDSTTRFSPNNQIADPTLFLDLAGLYIIELRVFDQQNTPSCETARVQILATPDEDIHIQTVWDTPGDPDQTDAGTGNGADLDLHFLHPAGNWNETPYDCFWRNIEPNWSSLNENSDDPSLDIDDTDGAGPENINLNNPENITYRVGVYYFSDHNFGPTYATIRIFLSQVLVFEYSDKYLERTGTFWDVATIEWGPSPRVNQIDQTYDGFP